jgi:uncharacterized protein YqfA (UPF0365 family)
MGKELAQAHNRMASITDEEKVMKAQIKERSSKLELTIGELSRKLNDGFDMQNISCELVYDTPNVGEVSYKRVDNGEIAKVRAMSEQERQLDLPNVCDDSILENSLSDGVRFTDVLYSLDSHIRDFQPQSRGPLGHEYGGAVLSFVLPDCCSGPHSNVGWRIALVDAPFL